MFAHRKKKSYNIFFAVYIATIDVSACTTTLYPHNYNNSLLLVAEIMFFSQASSLRLGSNSHQQLDNPLDVRSAKLQYIVVITISIKIDKIITKTRAT